jgi:hypothetical protein
MRAAWSITLKLGRKYTGDSSFGLALCILSAWSVVGDQTAFGQTAQGQSQQRAGLLDPLRDDVRLPTVRIDDPHVYEIHVDMTIQAAQVDKSTSAAYRLDLDCLPSSDGVENTVHYRCRGFHILKDGKPESHIPSLENWSYEFAYPASDVAPEGNVFGLPNARFLGLIDSNGKEIGRQNDFLVYNAFTDYHVLCNVYAQPLLEGKGIEDLKKIGDRVLHGTSNTHAPLGNVPGLSEGSEFVHGEVHLSWKGLSRIQNRPCAIVGFQTTDNRYRMVIKPVSTFSVVTEGKSRHAGDLYIDLESGWVLRAEMSETVVSWTDINGDASGPSVMHRSLTLHGRPREQTETTP